MDQGWVYVRRDDGGAVVAVSTSALADVHERVPVGDAAVQRYMASLGTSLGNAPGGAPQVPQDSRAALVASDLSFIRALEDVIDVLIAKDVIRLTDLPVAVQNKLSDRRGLRGSLNALNLLGDEQAII